MQLDEYFIKERTGHQDKMNIKYGLRDHRSKIYTRV